VIDDENGGNDSVDPMCEGGEMMKDQDVDEAHGKYEVPKVGCCMLKRTVCNF